MDDFEIELIDSDEKKNSIVQLPVNFLNIGEIENDDVKVYIKQDVYKKLEEYAVSDTGHELGTIILGDYAENMGKMHVVISEFIYAKYTDASASTLTFTHETWDYVHKEHEEKYPNLKIIGWQHTHPGYGIFLSNYDMFIQENFFNLPFQVAYVIDPIQHIRGFFQWKNGKVEKLKGFYIYDDPGKNIKIETVNTNKIQDGNVLTKQKPNFQGNVVLIIVVAALVVGLATTYLGFRGEINKLADKQEELEQVVAEQEALITSQNETISNLTINNDLEENAETENSSTEESETDKQAPVEEKEDVTESHDGVKFISYVVDDGDTLEAICEKNGLQYDSIYRVILSLNGIEDENKIYVGQTILLPINY